MSAVSVKHEPPGRVAEVWPRLGTADWEATRATLHLWSQMVGKTRLALAPAENHWWHVALYATTRGLTTSPMPFGTRTIEVEFDFHDHVLIARTSEGAVRQLALEPQSVADFYERYRTALRALGVEPAIWPHPVEMANAIPFAQDRTHASYDREAVGRFWAALVQVDRVFKTYRGNFLGKTSPVHFWWAGFDLACTRFSGRTAPPHPGGIPNTPDSMALEAYSHECMSVGFWSGAADMPVQEPVFYAYIYPEPPGCPEASMRPAGVTFHPVLREWILPYETVRQTPDPEATILEFARHAYETAANLGGWDRAKLERARGDVAAR